MLEAALVGAAKIQPGKFNGAKNRPTNRKGQYKEIKDWNLAQLIDVACEIGLLKKDSSKFGQILRDFRNYIYPEKQLKEDFQPDEYTSTLCFFVLKAALADLSRER